MSLLAQIKAKQQEEANNPYLLLDQPEQLAALIAQPAETPIEPFEPSELAQVKAEQREVADKTGHDPYAAREHPETGSAPAPAAPQTLEHYQAALSADLARLAPINDIVERAKLKLQMLATYWDFVKAYIDNGEHYANDVAVRICIWLFDVLDIERGLDVAFVLIKQNQITPAKFDRDLPTFVCDAVYDWAAALLKLEQPQSASPYLDTLVATLDNDKWSLAPPVQSKMYVILAKHKKRTGEWATVLELCKKAEQVNPEGAGVKGLLKEAQKQLMPANTGE